MKRILLTVALLQFAAFSGSTGVVNAAGSNWPSCTSPSQVECVESLSYTTASGTVNVANPGAPSGMQMVTQPYVQVTSADPSNPSTMLNFIVQSPSSTEIAPNVRTGLEDGTYTFVLRLGTYDPTQTTVSAEPVSISYAQGTDGNFTLSISAKPRPKVTEGPTTFATCKSGGWTCAGEFATVRNISGAVFQNTIPANRPLFRGMWIATNASVYSSPQVSMSERKVSAKIAGPHTVPPGFPTDGLTLENGLGLNPAYYRFFLPYSTIEAMLSMAPAEIRSQITPEMVKATITEAATQKDQPVTLVTNDSGMIVDLGLTHYSEPNPEVTFYTPSQIAAQQKTSAPVAAPKTYTVGKKYLTSGLVKVPSGYRVSRTVVSAASRKVCAVSGTRIQMKKAGSCSFTVTVSKGSTKKSIKGKVTVGWQ